MLSRRGGAPTHLQSPNQAQSPTTWLDAAAFAEAAQGEDDGVHLMVVGVDIGGALGAADGGVRRIGGGMDRVGVAEGAGV